MRQLSLANKATFLALADWIPNPPSSLGLIIFSTQSDAFSSSHWLTTTESLFILSSLSHKWIGRAAPCITWFGIADITDFTKTALLAKDGNLVFQHANLFITRSATKSNCLLGAPLSLRGNPNTSQNCSFQTFPIYHKFLPSNQHHY